MTSKLDKWWTLTVTRSIWRRTKHLLLVIFVYHKRTSFLAGRLMRYTSIIGLPRGVLFITHAEACLIFRPKNQIPQDLLQQPWIRFWQIWAVHLRSNRQIRIPVTLTHSCVMFMSVRTFNRFLEAGEEPTSWAYHRPIARVRAQVIRGIN